MNTRRLWLTLVALGIVAFYNSAVMAQGWRSWNIHLLDGTKLEANPLGMNSAGRFTSRMYPEKEEGIERSKISYIELGRSELPPLPEGDFKEDMIVQVDGTRTFGAVTFKTLEYSDGMLIQNGKEIHTEKIMYIKFSQPKKKKTKQKSGS